ncbi:MAG: hypothetical protein JNN20_03485 [Betaproteobacteria bacterium]|nr:hypothetical protein [Betaproteobacteria bacterium]
MSTTCPKCNFVRPADTTAPEWQCPSCGVAYAKARAAMLDPEAVEIPRRVVAEPDGLPWGRIMMGLLLLVTVLIAYKALSPKPGAVVSSATARVSAGGGGGEGQLARLASSVQTGDVVVYSAVWCGTCTEAKAWMKSNGFKYTECDVERNADCANRFRELGGNAIPLVIVRGEAMRAGFDSNEFVDAVKRSAS